MRLELQYASEICLFIENLKSNVIETKEIIMFFHLKGGLGLNIVDSVSLKRADERSRHSLRFMPLSQLCGSRVVIDPTN